MKKSIAFMCAACICAGLFAACTPEKALDNAQQNKQELVVYTSHRETVYGPIIKEFEERTGIWVRVVTGGSNTLLKRVENEAPAPQADVVFGGMAEIHEEYAQYLLPYASESKQFLRGEYLHENDLWTPFSTLLIVIVYNHRLLREREVPTGWHSLLDPALKGEISFANPENSASSFTALSIMTQVCPEVGMDMVTQFAENIDGAENLVQTSEELVNKIADGQCTVGVTLEDVVISLRNSGKEVGIVYPVEGTCAQVDVISIVKNAPNEANAKLFMDFATGRDVQQMIGEMGRRPVRIDTLPMKELPQMSEFLCLPYDAAWSRENRSVILARWKREF